MTRKLATSTIIIIFAAFLALYAALGIRKNAGEIESLESDSADEIASLKSAVEDIQSVLHR